MIDGLDTAYLLGMHDEFQRAVSWLAANLTMDRDHYVSVFEMNIRVLGGLLSAFDLSADERLLQLAVQVAEKLLPAFKPSGMPSAQLNVRTGATRQHSWAPGPILAELGSVQLEFTRLHTILSSRGAGGGGGGGSSQHHKNTTTSVDATLLRAIGAAAASMRELVAYKDAATGLFSRYPTSGMRVFALNGGCDSFYEYLLKLWLLTGRSEEWLRKAYAGAVDGMGAHLVRRCGDGQSGGAFAGEGTGRGEPNGRMEHLACFAPGMLALGAARGASSHNSSMSLAVDLAHTCWRLYADAPAGLAPDTINFNCARGTYNVADAKYSLRPETVETLFILWRVTHMPIYRERGWEIFQALQTQCRTNIGYSGLRSVMTKRNGPSDTKMLDNSMPSFWMAETLKYLYLLFSDDDVLPLDKWVFNTEAHPLRAS